VSYQSLLDERKIKWTPHYFRGRAVDRRAQLPEGKGWGWRVVGGCVVPERAKKRFSLPIGPRHGKKRRTGPADIEGRLSSDSTGVPTWIGIFRASREDRL